MSRTEERLRIIFNPDREKVSSRTKQQDKFISLWTFENFIIRNSLYENQSISVYLNDGL